MKIHRLLINLPDRRMLFTVSAQGLKLSEIRLLNRFFSNPRARRRELRVIFKRLTFYTVAGRTADNTYSTGNYAGRAAVCFNRDTREYLNNSYREHWICRRRPITRSERILGSFRFLFSGHIRNARLARKRKIRIVVANETIPGKKRDRCPRYRRK